VVMATHDHGIVDQMRKRVIELEDGRVIRDHAQGVYGFQH
jgi:cell division transport system ATP-binding protein